ncbi:hypothetical protein BDZ90DRAFT_74663 [Jaminaea rosea]|uniref:Uncharacterized protein n=1 Tax=Jaminaea rosea TaxID=1569628 RepID=A0A316UKD4_9BASI|nr:hypothetical protein BDZ90DRAFT_74663 [Jaminaea rosea]PWN25394.1 hypothetical protein BDZ90DRAFT_74663 [Jaminaea rosea]
MLGQLVSVSSLSIGPLTARRNGTCLVILDDAGLCSLEQLRICGLDGAEQATAFITSRSLAPRLASVQWDMRKAPASPHRRSPCRFLPVFVSQRRPIDPGPGAAHHFKRLFLSGGEYEHPLKPRKVPRQFSGCLSRTASASTAEH